MNEEKLSRAERGYIDLQIKQARKRLSQVHFSMSRDGYDPRLTAESELLNLQIASLQRELEG